MTKSFSSSSLAFGNSSGLGQDWETCTPRSARAPGHDLLVGEQPRLNLGHGNVGVHTVPPVAGELRHRAPPESFGLLLRALGGGVRVLKRKDGNRPGLAKRQAGVSRDLPQELWTVASWPVIRSDPRLFHGCGDIVKQPPKNRLVRVALQVKGDLPQARLPRWPVSHSSPRLNSFSHSFRSS